MDAQNELSINNKLTRLRFAALSVYTKKYIRAKDYDKLYGCLYEAQESAYAKLKELKLKSITAATLLTIFLGGWSAGRLYLGNYKFAALVIALTLILFFLLRWISELSLISLILLWTLAIAHFIWVIFEVFRTRVVCHRQNYAAVSGYLKKTRKN